MHPTVAFSPAGDVPRRFHVVRHGGITVVVPLEAGRRRPELVRAEPATPAVLAAPRLPGEGKPVEVLAVADRSRHRVLVLEPEGTVLGILGDEAGDATAGGDVRVGWPYFRTRAHPSLADIRHLAWADPWLVVDTEGRTQALDLADALLPHFEDWLSRAQGHELEIAMRCVRRRVETGSLAPEHLLRVLTRLGEDRLRSGRIEAAIAAWTARVSNLASRRYRLELRLRERLATGVAFERGTYAVVRPIVRALRVAAAQGGVGRASIRRTAGVRQLAKAWPR